MNYRHIAVLIFSWVTVVPVTTVRGQDLQPIFDRSRRIEIPGVSILPPRGDGWFLLPVSPQENIPANTMLRFLQRPQDAPPARPEDARIVQASVIVHDSGEARSRTPAEFLKAVSGGDDHNHRPGEMLTEHQRLLAFDAAALDDSLPATCVSYSTLTEFVDPLPAFPGSVAMTSTRVLYCSHPHWPQYHIDVRYEQLYAKGQAPLSRDGESDAFFKSVVFTSVRPVAPPEPSALWASHMQAGVAAYEKQRWSEAEVSFQAALKSEEDFRPRRPFLATTLYYLASTYRDQDRLTDAVPLFRRALDIFEAQPVADTPSVGFNQQYGRLYGQTLNDLGWIYSTQAARGATPSAVQSEREEAERLLQRALAVREKALGPDHIDVGQSAFNLMNLYRDWGRLTEAESAGRRALTIYERQKGANGAMVGEVLSSLSTVLRKLGREAEAQDMETRALAIRATGPTNR